MQIDEAKPIVQKPWQKGFDIEKIESIKTAFYNYNCYARSPFTEWNGPKIADSLHKNRLIEIPGAGYIDTHIAKTSTDIVMYYDIVIGRKLKGDRVINAFSFCPKDADKTPIKTKENFIDVIKNLSDNNPDEYCWAYIWEECPIQKSIINAAGFYKVGIKVTTFSEIYGIYFKDSYNDRLLRQKTRWHPQIAEIEKYNIVQLKTPDFTQICNSIAEKLDKEKYNYTNHYSKYNSGGAWGAVSLRGFSDNPFDIVKPACMSEEWHKKNPGRLNDKPRDTELFQKFPEVREIIKYLGTGKLERVRLMLLKSGNDGNVELKRHSDQVEKDLGTKDGTLMRIHIPVITNPLVIFSSWNYNGEEEKVNMKKGECWYLDIRKGHAARNDGLNDRIHLVIDIEATDELRNLLPTEA